MVPRMVPGHAGTFICFLRAVGDHQRFLSEDRSGMTRFVLWKYQSGCSVENRYVGFWSAFRQTLDIGERCRYPSTKGSGWIQEPG